jgi:hypothetical protein
MRFGEGKMALEAPMLCSRIWTFDHEVLLNRPHRVQFNY